MNINPFTIEKLKAQLDWWKVIRDDLKKSLVYRQEDNAEMPVMFVELR